MKKALGILLLSTFVITTASCSNTSKKEDYTLDDAKYQVSEEEFKNMENLGTEYKCLYNLYSGRSSIVSRSIELTRDNDKITLSTRAIMSSINEDYYSVINDGIYNTVKYANNSYSQLGNFDISEIMPVATSYIKMEDIYDNVTFNSISNEYVLKKYKENQDYSFTYDMYFKFEDKKLSSYTMFVYVDNSNSYSKVTIDYSYEDQNIQFSEEVINMLNN